MVSHPQKDQEDEEAEGTYTGDEVEEREVAGPDSGVEEGCREEEEEVSGIPVGELLSVLQPAPAYGVKAGVEREESCEGEEELDVCRVNGAQRGGAETGHFSG